MSRPGVTDDGTGIPADSGQAWELRLYVTDRSPKCLRAIENLRRVCEENLAGRYRIEVVDLLENPRLAADDQILAVPTVVRKLPRRSVSSSATCPTPSACSSGCSSGHPGVPTDDRRARRLTAGR